MSEMVVRPENALASVTGTLYLLLFPVPVVCFLGALVCDIAYSASAFLMWLHFSEWLIAVGLASGALAAIVLLIEFFASHVIRSEASGWAHLALFYAALVVELFNAFHHTIDGYTAVVPTGMILSVVGMVLALAAVAVLFFVPVTWFRHREVHA
jgi:uncharacterized membrane protein